MTGEAIEFESSADSYSVYGFDESRLWQAEACVERGGVEGGALLVLAGGGAAPPSAAPLRQRLAQSGTTWQLYPAATVERGGRK